MCLCVELPLLVLGDRAVAKRGAPIRGALKYDELPTIGGDRLNDLDAGGAAADDADPFAREVDRFFRPARGVQRLAREVCNPFVVWEVVRRQQPGSADHVAGTGAQTVVGFD